MELMTHIIPVIDNYSQYDTILGNTSYTPNFNSDIVRITVWSTEPFLEGLNTDSVPEITVERLDGHVAYHKHSEFEAVLANIYDERGDTIFHSRGITMNEVVFSGKVVGKVEVTNNLVITEEIVSDLMVGAIEGGINYWGRVTGHAESYVSNNGELQTAFKDIRKGKPEGEPISTWCAYLLLQGKSIWIEDIEDPEEIGSLTLEKLLGGIKKYAEGRYFDFESLDANDYDGIIQYAIFGNIVYS